MICSRSGMLVGLFAGLMVGGAGAQTVAASAGASQRPENFAATHYTKHEYMIPMRDGTKLFTAVYSPAGKDFKDAGPYPFLMSRTPYGCAPYGEDKVAPRVTSNETLVKSGYILVCQDVRGRWASEGSWLEMTPSKDGKGIDESTDMYDTVEWLLKNVANNNGKVGILGISYPGFYAAASIIDGHPAIKAASPQAPVTNLWMGDDSYHGGAFMLQQNHSFYTGFKPQKNPTKTEPRERFNYGTKSAYEYYLKMGTLAALDTPEAKTNPLFHDQVANTAYSQYWKSRNIAAHLHGVKAATMEVGGWFDAEDLSGPVNVFHSIDAQSGNKGTENVLVEGPWSHGGWSRSAGATLGDAKFGSDTSVFYREQIEAPFFEHHLKGVASAPLPKAYVFETGSNVWKKYESWPPKNVTTKTLYFHHDGGLEWTAPNAKASKDEYVSDPANPVPFTGYTTDTTPTKYMTDDQTFATKRADVLVYQTAPLTEDVTIVGPVKPRLKIASTGTDTDFVVKIIDVYPDGPQAGYEMLVRGEPMRAKYRNSWEKPEALTPEKVTAVDFTMQDVNHTFLKGHRIMVQVQSSWFPLVDRNPQVFEDIYGAKPEDFKKATETVFHEAGAASGVEVFVLGK